MTRTGARRRPGASEAGQTTVLLICILGIFLLSCLGFAVDLSNMWFHRQGAQSAADAACGAGALDMLYLTKGAITSSTNFTPGTSGDCFTTPSAALCQYAGFNGYTATTAAGGFSTSAAGAVAVNWTFPTTVSGVTAASVAHPFLYVVVQERPATWFMSLAGIKSLPVGTSCTCGLAPGLGAPPLIVLNPTIGSALQLSGGIHIVITGGPTASIQVNSSAASAINCSGGNGYGIDTSTAGPLGTGGLLQVVGGPATNITCGANTILNDPSNKLWKSSATVIADPYAAVPAPTLPAAPQALTSSPVGDTTGCIQAALSSGSNGCARKDPTYGFITGIWVGPGTDSCPNTIANNSVGTLHNVGQDPGTYVEYYGNCLEFSPGYYPTGINVASLAGWANDVSIFRPGVYYLNGNLTVGSSSTVRNAWIGTQPSTGGVIFYFLNGGPQFSGGSGAPNSNIASIPSYYTNCSGTTTPAGWPANLSGNILAAQCTTGGTYVGPPSSESYAATGARGLLFFTAHSDAYSQTLLGAGASLDFNGAMYFHNTAYADQVAFNGAGSSTTYGIGTMVVDQLNLTGAATIRLTESSAAVGGTPEASLFQ